MMHHESTMKIGTDAVLLGAMVSVPSDGRLLDVGTGSGIIALMLAQRSLNCLIDAIDIDLPSIEQAHYNFQSSRWKLRLTAIHSSLQAYRPELSSNQYNLILSNPPFFSNSFKTIGERRNLARHTDSLSHAELVSNTVRLLHPKGIFAVIIPAGNFTELDNFCKSGGLKLTKLVRIIPVEGRETNRLIIEYQFETKEKPAETDFVIRRSDSQFTPEYKLLLKDFYLGL